MALDGQYYRCEIPLSVIVQFMFPDTFNCDPPSPPSNGYIDSYNRTAEGLTVNFVCQNKTTCICQDEVEAAQDIVLHTAVCTMEESWEPNLEAFCSHQSMYTMHVVSQNDSTIACTGYNTKPSSDVSVVTVALATLAAVLLTSNALLFFLGCMCGHYLWQRCKRLLKRNSQCVLEDQHQRGTGAGDQELELERNVAYGHFRFENAKGN